MDSVLVALIVAVLAAIGVAVSSLAIEGARRQADLRINAPLPDLNYIIHERDNRIRRWSLYVRLPMQIICGGALIVAAGHAAIWYTIP